MWRTLLILLVATQAWGFDAAVTRVNLGTSTGTMNVTFSDFSEDCTAVTCAAIAILTTAVADDTAADGAMLSVGFTDGTNHRIVSVLSRDNLPTTDDYRRAEDDLWIISLDATGAQDGGLTFSSWLSTGVQINRTDAFPADYLLTVVIFGGAELDARVGSFISNASVNGETDVTGPGFTPDIVFLAGNRINSSDGSSGTHLFTFGVGVNDSGSDPQGSISCYSNDNQATVDAHSLTSTLYGASIADNGGVHVSISLGSYDASGFTATTKVAGSTASFAYLAMDIGTILTTLIDVDTRTSTGDSTLTAGFPPLFGMLLGTLARAYDVDEEDDDAASCMISFFTPDTQYAVNTAIEDVADTSNTFSLSDNTAIHMEQNDGTCVANGCFIGSYSDRDATTVTLNYSSVFNDAARKWLGFFIEDTEFVAAATPRVFQMIEYK